MGDDVPSIRRRDVSLDAKDMTITSKANMIETTLNNPRSQSSPKVERMLVRIPRSQSSPKVERMLVRICMEKRGVFWLGAWSMDSKKRGYL